MAFVRCLAPDVVAALAADATFAPEGWRVLRVADTEEPAGRTTDADTAVELRETKADATLLLVDTERAGAGMDGIYSAAREVGEAELFTTAGRLAGAAVTSKLSSAHRAYAERGIRRAQGVGRHDSVSPWVEFDFLCRVAAHGRHPGEYLHLLGLWPVAASAEGDAGAELAASRRFVDRLLGAAVTGLAVPARIASLRIPPGPRGRHPGHRTHVVAQPEREDRQVVGAGGTARGCARAGPEPRRPVREGVLEPGGAVEGPPGRPGEERRRLPRGVADGPRRRTGRARRPPLRPPVGEVPVQQR